LPWEGGLSALRRVGQAKKGAERLALWGAIGLGGMALGFGLSPELNPLRAILPPRAFGVAGLVIGLILAIRVNWSRLRMADLWAGLALGVGFLLGFSPEIWFQIHYSERLHAMSWETSATWPQMVETVIVRVPKALWELVLGYEPALTQSGVRYFSLLWFGMGLVALVRAQRANFKWRGWDSKRESEWAKA
jgi:hypothetical protein